MMTNVELMRSLYEAFGRGDAAAVLGAMAPDIVWTQAENQVYADRNPYIGPEAIAEGVFGRLATDWNVFAVNPERFYADGDTVIALGRYTGAHKASGRPLDAQFVHVWTLRDGKIARFEQFTDTLQFRAVQHKAAGI